MVQLCISDPYLNTDAGTMSPFEHGEVYVLDDGGEVSSFQIYSDGKMISKLNKLTKQSVDEIF